MRSFLTKIRNRDPKLSLIHPMLDLDDQLFVMEIEAGPDVSCGVGFYCEAVVLAWALVGE